jgi:transposase
VGGCGRWPEADTYESVHLGNKWTLRGERSLRESRRDDGGLWGEKCRIVEQTLKPDASVARVALAHGVNANQVFSWRRQYRQGLLSRRDAEPVKLLPVHVSEAQASKANPSENRQVTAAVVGTIQVEFPKGHVCISASVDGEALRSVVEHLLR